MITQNPDYLIAIVQAGNLTKAAEKLFVSQPSLSQYLKRLERSLNAELFDRSVSPMKLTYAGERYYEYILHLKQLEVNMQEELLNIRHELKGVLHLGIALWRGACLIPDVYPEFHRRYPHVELRLFEGRFAQLKSALVNHEIDIAIANLLPAGSYGGFEIEPIIPERILLAAPTRHPLVQMYLQKSGNAGDTPVCPPDILHDIPLVLTKEGQSLTEMVMSVFAREHITPNILMETGNLTTAINLTAKGVCCTFVPEEGAGLYQDSGDIAFFAVDKIDLHWTLAFMYRKESSLGIIKRNFIDCTKEILKQRSKRFI